MKKFRKNILMFSITLSILITSFFIVKFVLFLVTPIKEPFNLLITAADTLKNKQQRFDSITLIHFPSEINSPISILSIPRDTIVFDKNNRSTKINSFTKIEELKKKLEEVISAKIDYTTSLQIENIEKIVDILGGLKINVERCMSYDDNSTKLHIDLKKGIQSLNGKQIHHYLRFRKLNEGKNKINKCSNSDKNDTDLDRTKRKISIILAFLDKTIKNPTKIFKIIDYIKSLDIPFSKYEAFYIGRNLYYASQNGLLRTNNIAGISQNGEIEIYKKNHKDLLDEPKNLISSYFGQDLLESEKKKFTISIFNVGGKSTEEIDLAMKLISNGYNVVQTGEKSDKEILDTDKKIVVTAKRDTVVKPYIVKGLIETIEKNKPLKIQSIEKKESILQQDTDINIYVGKQ